MYEMCKDCITMAQYCFCHFNESFETHKSILTIYSVAKTLSSLEGKEKLGPY